MNEEDLKVGSKGTSFRRNPHTINYGDQTVINQRFEANRMHQKIRNQKSSNRGLFSNFSEKIKERFTKSKKGEILRLGQESNNSGWAEIFKRGTDGTDPDHRSGESKYECDIFLIHYHNSACACFAKCLLIPPILYLYLMITIIRGQLIFAWTRVSFEISENRRVKFFPAWGSLTK